MSPDNLMFFTNPAGATLAIAQPRRGEWVLAAVEPAGLDVLATFEGPEEAGRVELWLTTFAEGRDAH